MVTSGHWLAGMGPAGKEAPRKETEALVKVRFWGVRGSIATPLTTQALRGKIEQAVRLYEQIGKGAVSVEEFLEYEGLEGLHLYGGNTACVEVSDGAGHIILDAGTGLRELGLELARGNVGNAALSETILVSHLHWDHIQGLPFFAPLFMPGARITIASGSDNIVEALATQQQHPYFPVPFDDVPAEVELRVFDPDEEISLNGFRVRSIGVTHPGGCYAYRIEGKTGAVAYVTDAELLLMGPRHRQALCALVEGCGVVIADCQYAVDEVEDKRTWGHSSLVGFVELFRQTNIGKLLAFHYDPNSTDERIDQLIEEGRGFKETETPEARYDIEASREGMVLETGFA